MPNELIYDILKGILYIGIPFLILVLCITTYNTLSNIKEGINSSMNDLSFQIAQRNNEIPKLIEKANGIINDKRIEEVNRLRQNIKRAVELRDSERIAKAESALQRQLKEVMNIAMLRGLQGSKEMVQNIRCMNSNIQEITDQYNFKVKDFNHSISSLPLIVFAKPLNLKKINEISYE